VDDNIEAVVEARKSLVLVGFKMKEYGSSDVSISPTDATRLGNATLDATDALADALNALLKGLGINYGD